MKLITTVSIFILAVYLSLTCDKTPTGPEPYKDPRAYTWRVDTLVYPDAFQTNMLDIAGTSASNVFTVGHNSTSSAGTMYRFDGRTWKTTGFHMSEGGPISGAISLKSLHVFSPANIWFVGDRSRLNPNPPPNFIDSSFILHYNGSTWQEHKAYGARALLSIHGVAPNDIWACGFDGTLLHYNGTQWTHESVPVVSPPNGGLTLREILVISTQTVYMLGFGFVVENGVERITYHYFFQRRDASWAVVDSFPDADRITGSDKWGFVGLWAGPSGTLYSLGPIGVWRWTGAQWLRILDWYGGPLQAIWGYNDNSFFIGGYQTVLHYNGSDFHQYRGLTDDVVFRGFWGDRNDLFILAGDGRKSFLYHGR